MSLTPYGADIFTQSPNMSAPVPKTTQEIVAAITTSNGLLPLAAERLKMSPDEIVIALADDPTAPALLASYFRVSLLLNTYMNLHLFTESVMKCMAYGDYGNDIKAMNAFASLFIELTKAQAGAPQLNVNVFERTMALLPKNVREQVVTYIEETSETRSLSLPELGRARITSGNDDDD